MAIWITTSLPCGLADTATGVILYRLLQGIGGSLHIPTVITMMYQAFPPQQRGLAMGVQQGAQWIAPAVGMTLGGYLIQLHGWRAVFFYPIPIGLVAIALALWGLPRMRQATHQVMDWWGIATLTAALTLLLFAVSQSQRPGWNRLTVLLVMVVGLIGMLTFVVLERRHKTPIIDLGLFRHRGLRAASGVYFLNTFTGMGVNFAVIIYLQQALGYNPLQVGFLLLPAALGRSAGELAAGHLADRWGPRGLSLAGLLSFSVACAALGRVDQQSGLTSLAALLILGNVGMAFSNSPMIHAGLQTLHDERIGLGSGLLSLVRIVGGTFGVGAVGPLVAIAEHWSGSGLAGNSGPDGAQTGSLVAGYHLYFYLMALLILSTMLPALLVPSVSRRAEG
jgi:EmrB/QacA subfamily drug resistance transporter